MRSVFINSIVIACYLFIIPAYGQAKIPDSLPGKSITTEKAQPLKPPPTTTSKPFRTTDENILTKWFLVFGLLVLLISATLLYKFSNDSNVAFKYFIIVLLVLGMLVMIVVGYNEKQISSAVGLFGTIAGYLLGKSDSSVKPEPKTT